jgi:cyclopropane fatty-acyl-phospholipid synthase-like methyltransferase/ribosomal protein S18 acetylase RimI-like enzyme
MSPASGAGVKFTLREIDPGDKQGLEQIATLHMELLDYGPMAGLGKRFVREICYRAHMQDETLRVVIAEVNGEPAGFVAYTPYSLSFHRSGLREHLVRAGLETGWALLSRPARIIRLLRALRVLGSRRLEVQREEEDLGEVVCIAVRPQYLAPSFARAHKLRISEILVRHAAGYLRRAGLAQMRMLVDADNKAVLMLYHFLGAHFRDYSLGGEPMVEVVFDLKDARISGASDVPECWNEPPPQGAAAGSWRAYWESIDDRQGFFSTEAADHVARLVEQLAPSRDARVLDFGCGFGFAARLLARRVALVALWDGAASVRRRARLRTAHLGNVEYVDIAEPTAVAEKFDLITVHSVLQYMSEEEVLHWFARWKSMLAPGGRLVLSDLIQPSTKAVPELAAYLAFSLKSGFFLDALMQGLREVGKYSRARATRPLTIATPQKIEAWARQAGLRAQFLERNLSYRSSRMTAVLAAA